MGGKQMTNDLTHATAITLECFTKIIELPHNELETARQ